MGRKNQGKRIRPYHGAGIVFWTMGLDGTVKVLLGRRTKGIGKGKWAYPGGGWERMDGFRTSDSRPDYARTARRECREEVHIDAELASGAAGCWALHLPFFHWEVFQSESKGPVMPVRYHEFTELGWFAIDALPKPMVPLVASQVIRAVHVATWPGPDTDKQGDAP